VAESPPAPSDAAESEPVESSKIMIVDDEQYNILVVQKYLRDRGFCNLVATCDATQAMAMIDDERPDVLLLDIIMPEVDGLQILQAVRQDRHLCHVPVLILTASAEAEVKLRALELGATDFLAKPVDPSELILRLRNTLLAKAHLDHLEDYSERLEQQVRLRTEELRLSRQEVIHCLARAAEYRDEQTGKHVIRVGRSAGIIARQLGLDEARCELIEQAAQLHDVGKIGVSDTILLKPGRYEPEEFELMKRHCEFGGRIMQPADEGDEEPLRRHAEMGAHIMDSCSSPIMRIAAVIAMTHHERFDGTGYPRGLADETIPIEGRITAVADVYDALSSPRPYKPAFSREKCLSILEEGRGSHFDPRVLDALLARLDEIDRVQAEFADEESALTACPG
jgi:putative two-component system response regulator